MPGPLRTMILLIVISALVLAATAAALAAPPVTETEFILFFPGGPLARQARGECWTSSNFLPRTNAWRCAVGNLIYDPCLSQSPTSSWVACDIDPVSDGARGVGLRVNLTAPLPNTEGWTDEYAFDWVIELEDGRKCAHLGKEVIFTVDGDVNYACAGSDFIMGDTFQPEGESAYYATVVSLSADGNRIVSSTLVPARRVWY